jgi:hypothetical protein
VIWDGQARTVESDAADSEPLVGMSLIYGYDLRIQAVDGGTVTLEALPYAGAKVATKPGLLRNSTSGDVGERKCCAGN